MSFVILHKAVFHSSLITCGHGADIDNFDVILVKVQKTVLEVISVEHGKGITDAIVPYPGREATRSNLPLTGGVNSTNSSQGPLGTNF